MRIDWGALGGIRGLRYALCNCSATTCIGGPFPARQLDDLPPDRPATAGPNTRPFPPAFRLPMRSEGSIDMTLGPLPWPLAARLRSWCLLGFGCSTVAALVSAGGLWASSATDGPGGPGLPLVSLRAPVCPSPAGVTALPLTADRAIPGPRRDEATPESRPAEPAPERSEASDATASSEAEKIERAKAMVAECRSRYATLQDYRCVFYKRERMPSGRMTPLAIMQMKARTSPRSIYFKFLKPHAGREAIWVDGTNDGKVVVHDVGLGKLLAGTLHLDPTSRMAMADSRHPITEAGLGHLIQTVTERWDAEMRAGETLVAFHHDAVVGDRECTMIESIHPSFDAAYNFHKVKLYIDQDLKLPIRFEAYDWPAEAGAEAPLVEEYTYLNFQADPGLDAAEFDPGNEAYAFGRF